MKLGGWAGCNLEREQATIEYFEASRAWLEATGKLATMLPGERIKQDGKALGRDESVPPSQRANEELRRIARYYRREAEKLKAKE